MGKPNWKTVHNPDGTSYEVDEDGNIKTTTSKPFTITLPNLYEQGKQEGIKLALQRVREWVNNIDNQSTAGDMSPDEFVYVDSLIPALAEIEKELTDPQEEK